jgi:tetratricopeptide (TPR) repeat protein
MLQHGIGSIHAKQGSYEAAIPAYLNCYETAYRIGNDRLYLQASANLSLSFMRSGEYDSAVEWAERTLAVDAIDITPGFHVQAAESAVLSYAMMGKDAQAVEMIHKRREEFANWGSIGISQAWALYSADSYAMLGRISEALQEGRRGTEGTNSQLHMDFCAGPYARWLARTGEYGLMTKATQERLDVLVLNLESYDVMDQADILNARCWLSSRDGQPLPRDVDGMLKRLNALPRAVRDQLRRMGMLDLGSLDLSGFALPYAARWPTHTL